MGFAGVLGMGEEGGGERCKGKAAKPMRGYFAREEKILNISGVSYLLFFIVSIEFGHSKLWIRIRIKFT
jgi:hypothetical protein